MDENALVSIIVPVFNAEQYIEKNVINLLNQTYQKIEIIYVCDGCTDGSANILKRFLDDCRLKIIVREENRGAAFSRNQGAHIAHGEWLIFFDADDEIKPDAIEKMHKAVSDYSADMAICSFGIIGEEVGEKEDRLFNYIKRTLTNYPVLENTLINPELSYLIVCNAPYNKLIRRNLFETGSISFQELKNCNDIYFSVASFLNSERIVYIEEKLYYYRTNSIGSLTSGRTQKKSYILEALEKIRELINKKGYPERVFKDFAYNEIMDYRGTGVFQQLLTDYRNKYEKSWSVSFGDNVVYSLEDKEFYRNKKIVLYGAGKVGKDFFSELNSITEIVAWVDSNARGENVFSVSEINRFSFDLVIIANKSDFQALQMKEKMLSLGVEEQKICLPYPIYKCYGDKVNNKVEGRKK